MAQNRLLTCTGLEMANSKFSRMRELASSAHRAERTHQILSLKPKKNSAYF